MRIFAAILAIALVLLQYRLWFSDQGMREVSAPAGLRRRRSAPPIRSKSERNRQLGAEVTNLKGGLAALEERARSELGMVGASETFYQVVRRQLRRLPPRRAAPVTARAQ